MLHGLSPELDARLKEHKHYNAFLRDWQGLVPELVRRHRETKSEKVRASLERLLVEQACDAWAVWALPEHRRAYAEALIDIAEQRLKPITRAPVLGVSESEPKDFQKRLSMIMKPRVSHRGSPLLAVIFVHVRRN